MSKVVKISPEGKVIRALITEALGNGGETFEDLCRLIEDDNRLTAVTDSPANSIRATLASMGRDELVEKRKDRWYLLRQPDSSPTPPLNGNAPRPSGILAAGVSGHNDLPAFQQKRAGKSVTLEATPAAMDNVYSVEFRINGTYFPIPLFGNMRICIGPETPRWSPEQTTYRNVSQIKITLKNGDFKEYPQNPQYPVTVASLDF